MSSDLSIPQPTGALGLGQPRLTQRETLCELMDGPCHYGDLHACLRDLAAVNQLTSSHEAATHWLQQFEAQARSAGPLHVVDVGCGGGDALRFIEHWAAAKNIPLRLTGIDCNPQAIRAARAFTPPASRIEWCMRDVESLPSNEMDAPVDVVISSLLTHHLSDAAIVSLLKWMESTARLGWFVNDLYRTRVGCWGFAALALCARWHRFVRHDGPISFRRAFVPQEWYMLCDAAGVPREALRVDARWPARIYVSRVVQR